MFSDLYFDKKIWGGVGGIRQISRGLFRSNFDIKSEKGEVHCTDIAEFLKFSRPSVSYAIKELRKKEFVKTNRNASLELTEKGRVLAEKIYERHEFFKTMLLEAGVQQEIAEKEGCYMEHVLCDDSFQKLKKYWKEKRR